MKPTYRFLKNLFHPTFAPTGVKVAIVVGTLLFVINHGNALVSGRMSRDRWVSALLTYLVPYVVNVHGQYTSTLKMQER
jgi:hypothetical protein